MDTACAERKFSDGSMIAIGTNAVEFSLTLANAARIGNNKSVTTPDVEVHVAVLQAVVKTVRPIEPGAEAYGLHLRSVSEPGNQGGSLFYFNVRPVSRNSRKTCSAVYFRL